MDSNITEDWALYEAGKRYNNRLEPNYYDTVDANIAFFNGDQWRNLKADKMPKPVFNIIKRVITFFVASMTSSKVKLNYEPMLLADDSEDNEELDATKVASEHIDTLFDKFKMDFKVKDALFDAAITGDMAAHFYFDINKEPFGSQYDQKGEICMELVDGANVFFGNANNPNAQEQPYIIISGRDMVQNLQEEAKQYKKKNMDNIQSDHDYQNQLGDAGKIEVEGDDYGKALYIIKYTKDKKTGEIHASKSVKNAYIYQDIPTGLKHYPLVWNNWEKQKNQYHGRALCTGMLPNQIFINRMFAMVMYHLMMTAFPKAVYNADILSSWNSEIGSAIPIKGMDPAANIKNVAGYLEPSNMSNQITEVIEMAMQYTKETLGISDAALGQVDPKNTSAIIAVQKSSAIPLENPKSNLYEWVEDIGRILFDMMGTYYGVRPIVREKDGQKVIEEFDFSQLKDLYPNIKADVGEATYWSELASIETLDNLLSEERISFLDYLKRVPDEYIPQKQELISDLEEQMEQQEMQMNPEELIAQLSPEEQQAFHNAPPEQQQAILQQVMQQAPM